MIRALVAASLIAAAAPCAAGEKPATIVRGTNGLVEVPFRADNQASTEIACIVTLAHWYSFNLGRASPRACLTSTLWSDPRDGTILILNAAKDHIPVETLWCGADRNGLAAGPIIPLTRTIGAASTPIRVTCHDEASRVICR